VKEDIAMWDRYLKGLKIFMVVCAVGLLTVFVLSCGGSSGGGDGDGGGGSTSNGITYVTSIGGAGITTGYYETIDVASDGSVYLLADETNLVGSKRIIHVFDSSYEYAGTFGDIIGIGGINADDLIVDAFDRIHVYKNHFGDMIHKIYETDGTLVSSFSGSFSISPFAVAQDAEQNHYLIPFSGVGVGDERFLFVWKLNHDFNSLISELDKSDLLQMLPGPPDEMEVTLSDIRIAPNNFICICVYLSGDYISEEGVLILDENFQKVKYLGGNWLLDDPRAVDFDASGNLYVSSTWHNKVMVFNDKGNKIASIGVTNLPDGLLQEELLPADIRVKGGKLYLLDPRNDYIHIFTTIN
jgi:hypothetical protein